MPFYEQRGRSPSLYDSASHLFETIKPEASLCLAHEAALEITALLGSLRNPYAHDTITGHLSRGHHERNLVPHAMSNKGLANRRLV